MLRCRDIPTLPGLEAIRLRGGQAGEENVIRWPYVAENRSFRDWVDGGELVFVTGISRHRSPENLAECLYEGRQCGIAGLVVLTGEAYIGQFPTILSRLADELSIPVFEQPYSLPMVRVTEAVSRAIVAREQPTSADTLSGAIVDRIGGDQLETLLDRYLPPTGTRLPEAGDLLDAWLTHGGNQQAMAQALGCHRNTIRNRMHGLTGALTHAEFRTLLLAHLLTGPDSATTS